MTQESNRYYKRYMDSGTGATEAMHEWARTQCHFGAQAVVIGGQILLICNKPTRDDPNPMMIIYTGGRNAYIEWKDVPQDIREWVSQ